jgi:hypothetical protein
MVNGPFDVSHSPFATHHSPPPGVPHSPSQLAIRLSSPCATFPNEKIILTHFDILEKRNHRIFKLRDRRSPQRIRKPHEWEMAEKPRSPASEQAMNSTRTGELRPQ